MKRFSHWVASIQEEGAGAVRFVCECGLQLAGPYSAVVAAWTSHVKVAEPGLYRILVDEDEGHGP